jgi:PilZ domain
VGNCGDTYVRVVAGGVDVSASSGMNYALRMLQYMRAGARVNSRVKVAVEWVEGGATHSAEGYTVDISPKGCLAIVPQGFAVGQKLRLKNGSNARESDAVLIWRGHEGRSGWELGLELVHPPAEFWGVEF